MTERFDIKKGDTSPDFTATLVDADGAAVNLTGATIRFLVRSRTALVVNAAMTIVDSPALGKVKYAWQTGDTGTPAVCKGECEVTYSGGGKQTFPSVGHFMVIIGADLDV